MAHAPPPTLERQPPMCFAIRGKRGAQRYAWVHARDLESARARLAPLFPGCELVPVEDSELGVHPL